MAIDHPSPNRSPRPAVSGRDSHGARAPFPSRAEFGRLTARAREEITGRRLADASSRIVARCPACGTSVRDGEDYVRSRGDLYHPSCMLYRRTPSPND
jgi:hypothetical protein